MKSSEMYNLAFSLATKNHEGQVDKAGKAYIFHLSAVAEMAKTPQAKIVAILHDILEDTSVTEDDLLSMGFTEDIVNAIVAISQKPGETRTEYLKRVKENPLAKEVKILDLIHNSDLSRLPEITEADERRRQAYQRELQYLKEE